MHTHISLVAGSHIAWVEKVEGGRGEVPAISVIRAVRREHEVRLHLLLRLNEPGGEFVVPIQLLERQLRAIAQVRGGDVPLDDLSCLGEVGEDDAAVGEEQREG